MIAAGRFDRARTVFELGFGTGRLAEMLLRDQLPKDSRYLGVEVSSTMHRLASDRLAKWSDRIELGQLGSDQPQVSDGSPPVGVSSNAIDRFVATYVFDLMEQEMIRLWLIEAHRILAPAGLICIVSLTHGRRPFARLVSRTWELVQSMIPEQVGGCRPISPSSMLEASGGWRIELSEVITVLGVSSEVCVAKPAFTTDERHIPASSKAR